MAPPVLSNLVAEQLSKAELPDSRLPAQHACDPYGANHDGRDADGRNDLLPPPLLQQFFPRCTLLLVSPHDLARQRHGGVDALAAAAAVINGLDVDYVLEDTLVPLLRLGQLTTCSADVAAVRAALETTDVILPKLIDEILDALGRRWIVMLRRVRLLHVVPLVRVELVERDQIDGHLSTFEEIYELLTILLGVINAVNHDVANHHQALPLAISLVARRIFI